MYKSSSPAAHPAERHKAAVSGADGVCDAAACPLVCGADVPPHASHPVQPVPRYYSLHLPSPNPSHPAAEVSAEHPAVSCPSDLPGNTHMIN